MLLDKGIRYPIRASVEHLDPDLYDRLEPGDQLVFYTRNILLSGSWTPRNACALAGALVEHVEARDLAFEIVDMSPTRLVWEIIPASAFVNAAE